MTLMVSHNVPSLDKLFSNHIQAIRIGRGRQGSPKGNFRQNEGLLVGPGAENEVVKSLNMATLVRPDIYP